MVRVRIGNELTELQWEEWEDRVRRGRIPFDAEVCIPALTGAVFVRADALESYRALAGDAEQRWHDAVVRGSPPIATALLVGVQVRIWWWQFVPAWEGPILDSAIAFAPAIYENGESWRWLTMGLLHSDFGHVAMNLLWLAYVGWNVERALGRANFIAIYFASVMGGSLLSTLGSPWTPSLGASGGVFGLIAATTVFGLTRPELLPERMRKLFGFAMLPYMLVTFWSGLQSRQTDNWAHFGGLITGALLAWILDPSGLQRRPGWNRRWYAGLIALGATLLLAPPLLGPSVHPLIPHTEAAKRALKNRGERVEVVESPEPPVEAPLRWSVPAGWKPGEVTAAGDVGFRSPVGDRVWSVREAHHDHPVDTDTLSLEWIAALQRAFPDVEISDPGEGALAGRPADRRIALVGAPGATRRLEWFGVARGHWSLEAIWEVELERNQRFEPLEERLRAAVTWEERPEVVAARAGLATTPESFTRKLALAEQLSDIGAVDEAAVLWRDLHASRPEDQDLLEGVFAFIRSYPGALPAGSPLDVVPLIDATLARSPNASLIVQVVATLETLGEADTAQGLLDLAWDQHPGDRDLRRARKARGLRIDLDPATARPVDRLVDPWGRPRVAPPVSALSLDAARSAGSAIAAERQRLIDEAIASVGTEDPRALLRLKHRGLPADTSAAAGLAEDLRTVRADGAVDWMPPALRTVVRERLERDPDWPNRLITPATP